MKPLTIDELRTYLGALRRHRSPLTQRETTLLMADTMISILGQLQSITDLLIDAHHTVGPRPPAGQIQTGPT